MCAKWQVYCAIGFCWFFLFIVLLRFFDGGRRVPSVVPILDSVTNPYHARLPTDFKNRMLGREGPNNDFALSL